MITAQDIQEKAFERAGKGYNMEQVDEFLDELAADFSAMSRENASLKSKMKMLVQKMDEYRQTEDSMRLALLSAQKLSSQIESEAREKSDSLIAEAKQQAERLTREAADGIANENAKLDEAKKATDRFFDHMRTVCQKQIEFYDKLSQMHLVGGMAEQEAEEEEEEPAPEEEEEEDLAEAAPAEEIPEPVSEPEPAPEDEVPEQDEPTRLFPTGGAAPKGKRKRRSYDEFSFDDEI